MKKNKKIVIVVILIALGFYLLNYFGVTGDIRNLTVSTEIIDEGQITPSYICPTGASYCRVKGTIVCDVAEGEQKVIFRTNANSVEDYDEEGTWIAIGKIPVDKNLIDVDNLQGYCRTSTTSGAESQDMVARGGSRMLISFGTYAFSYNSDMRIDRLTSGSRKYEPCTLTSTQLSLVSQPSYYSKGQEIIGGVTDLYQCSGEFKLNSQLKDSLTYSSQISGKDTTSWYTIQPGDKAEILGGDDNYIDYQVISEYETCVRDYCQGSEGYVQCVDGLPGKFIACDNLFKCKDGECVPPIDSINLELKDSQGIIKMGFTPENEINAFVQIVSEFNPEVTLTVRKGNTQGEIVYEETKKLVSGETKKFIITNPRFTGTYFVILNIDLGLNEEVFYGRELDEITKFVISSEYESTFQQPYQIINGQVNRENIYENYPVTFNLITTSGGSPVFLDSDPLLNLGGISLSPKSKSKGLYTYEFIPTNAGKYLAEVKTFYGGIQKQVSTEVNIIPEDVVVKWLIVADKEYSLYETPSMQIGQSYNFKFETRNRAGNLISTSNKLIVDEVTVENDISNQLGGDGVYTFTYTPSKRGGYEFTVQSSKLGLQDSQLTSTGIIQSTPEPPKPDCTTDDECGFLKECVNNTCSTKLELLIVGIGFIFILIVILIIVVNIIKRRQSVNLNL